MSAQPWSPGADPAQPVDPTAFRAIFRRHPAGVAVVTLTDGDRPVGFTATSVISVSAEPPVLVFSVAGTSSSWPALARAGSLTVNFLAADQVDVSARFATSGIDRFAGVDWRRLPTGEPVISGVPSWVRGEVLQRTAVGSSFLVAVRAVEAAQLGSGPPLVYHDRGYHRVDGSSAV
ncbi:NADH-FMN oxidoreductase RutF, flavin reductase (DIM6/NTAB) family [Friedmanniella luteola]|uniref:NADH-FMN oxidoreductase RutF, flavin reductase (DIM6/NTAB) family n=1 Tax=Friedmanniella luteola TaxID=546871 RepID=A0A1H1WFZ9_9ACTN|nr:flavin reductase family protein [Friedmanniella luteola]SDS96197.1 NADH-FMN oxidoreductase RutF, flavin reductase (DIM6/NTAB) family [Friedmanniella luteola]